MNTLNSSLQEKQTEFESTLDPLEVKCLREIKAILVTLDEGPFDTWPIDKLISAREKLARWSEPLGEFITAHEVASDYAYVWRKGMYAVDWMPMKSNLEAQLGKKVTNADAEQELTAKYLQEQYFSLFHRHRADLLIREMESLDRMLRVIDLRIRELERQLRLEQ